MTKSILKISILLALSFIGGFGLLSEPHIDSQTWFLDLAMSKALAALAIFGIYKLYPRWAKDDKWIAAFHKWSTCDEEGDTEW